MQNLFKILIYFSVAFLFGCSQNKPNHPATGFIDTPAAGQWQSPYLIVEGWVFDPESVAVIEVILNDELVATGKPTLKRVDVAAAHPEYPSALNSGFRITVDLSKHLTGNDNLRIESVDNEDGRTVLGKFKKTENLNYHWKNLLTKNSQGLTAPFYIAIATSGLFDEAVEDLLVNYSKFQKGNIRLGMRIPILYMRATKGAKHDWIFDPDFDTDIKGKNGRKINDDSLTNILKLSKEFNVPVMITLNGGVWADASGTEPEWDLIDHLEQTPINVQWTANKETPADNYLSELPGSMGSPELARALTLNTYAHDVIRYKKRNLKAAAREIKKFADENPDLFIGINSDPDVYINPFFEGKEWFDYNPNTVRQFREWLSGTGPYSGGGKLEEWKHQPSLRLEQINQLADKKYSDWAEVEAPVPGRKYWENPWFVKWQQFRRHLVHMHHEDITNWLAESGIPSNKIFTSQGFASVSDLVDPFPIYITSKGKNYDTAGVSIEGAKPENGHLGAILYGDAARNRARMEGDLDFFSQVQQFDLDWAIPEFNLAHIHKPEETPDYETAYRAFQQLFNSNVRLISPMAWNGSNGIFAGEPGFVSYTSWRNTPQEQAFKDLATARQGLSKYAKFWPFGFNGLRSNDGWKGLNSEVESRPSTLVVKAHDKNSAIQSGPIFLKQADQYELLLKIKNQAHPITLRAEFNSLENKDNVSSITAELAPVVEDTFQLTIPASKVPSNPVTMTLVFNEKSSVVVDFIALVPME